MAYIDDLLSMLRDVKIIDEDGNLYVVEKVSNISAPSIRGFIEVTTSRDIQEGRGRQFRRDLQEECNITINIVRR